MAIVIASPNESTLGWIVKIKEYLGDSYAGYRNVWWVEAENNIPPLGRWIGSDSWLLPIRPGDLQETDEAEREIENA
jgi:hypothetical protein